MPDTNGKQDIIMIHVTIYKTLRAEYTGFDSLGHAGYAKAGADIVCAGVSALVLNTVNSLEALTEDIFSVDTDAEAGRISLRFQKSPSKDGKLLMDSLVLGLQGIQDTYGNKYISLICKEV